MESGLEDRNNMDVGLTVRPHLGRLNGVRPRRPEQFTGLGPPQTNFVFVSMESGLEDRNNARIACMTTLH